VVLVVLVVLLVHPVLLVLLLLLVLHTSSTSSTSSTTSTIGTTTSASSTTMGGKTSHGTVDGQIIGPTYLSHMWGTSKNTPPTIGSFMTAAFRINSI
jgi:hypothetical protein